MAAFRKSRVIGPVEYECFFLFFLEKKKNIFYFFLKKILVILRMEKGERY